MKHIIAITIIALMLVSTFGAVVAENETSTTPIGCTEEAKICPDGSVVSRNSSNNCEFDKCPERLYCDANNRCPKGQECYKFPDEKKPYCYIGDPCTKCESRKCMVLESYPAQIRCEPLETNNIAKISINIYPETQKAQAGEWTSYEVVVKDLHYNPNDCKGPVCPAIAMLSRDYTYILSLDGDVNMISEHKEIVNPEHFVEIILGAEEKKSVKISVSSNKEGAHKFKVKAVQTDDKSNFAEDKAVLLVGGVIEPPKPRVLFQGDGFIENSDETKAKFAKLHLLAFKKSIPTETTQGTFTEDETTTSSSIPWSNTGITGKAKIGNNLYRIRGSLSGQNVELKFYEFALTKQGKNIQQGSNEQLDDDENELETDDDSDEELEVKETDTGEILATPDATFSGTLRAYSEISVLKGKFIEGTDALSTWQLTAMSKTKGYVIRQVTKVEQAPIEVPRVQVGETIPIESVSEASIETEEISKTEQTYIQPTAVYRPKLLNVIPNPFAKKVVEAKVLSDNRVEVIKIREGETKLVGKYNIKAKNLQDEKNIDFEISQAPQEA